MRDKHEGGFKHHHITPSHLTYNLTRIQDRSSGRRNAPNRANVLEYMWSCVLNTRRAKDDVDERECGVAGLETRLGCLFGKAEDYQPADHSQQRCMRVISQMGFAVRCLDKYT